MSGFEPTPDQRVFVAALAKMVSPMHTEDAVLAMMPMLGADDIRMLPRWVFDKPTDLALEIGIGFERVPTLAKFRQALVAYHQRKTPTSPRSTELEGSGLAPNHRALVIGWLNDANDQGKSDGDLTTALSVVRRYAEPGFNWLVANNPHAQQIAERKGWVRENTAGDFTDPARILASVRGISVPPHPQANHWLSCLRAAVERNAPELVDLVPRNRDEVEGDTQVAEDRRPTRQQRDDMLADGEAVVTVRQAPAPAERFEAKHGRPAGSLSPEHLQAVRMANPALRPIAEREASRHLTPANDPLPPDEDRPPSTAPPGLVEAHTNHIINTRPTMPWDDEP